MSTKTLNDLIESTPGVAGGKPRVAGSRITVQNIAIWNDRLGKSPDDIAAEYDLSLAQVHAALAYYFSHRDEIDLAIREGDEFVRELRQSMASPLREKLSAHGGPDWVLHGRTCVSSRSQRLATTRN